MFLATAAISVTALVGLAAPASAAVSVPHVGAKDAGLLSLCITIRPSAPFCIRI
jgi:hypothetical protein